MDTTGVLIVALTIVSPDAVTSQRSHVLAARPAGPRVVRVCASHAERLTRGWTPGPLGGGLFKS